jgi:23S rRNA (adenine2030-N6)-methyltransferase
MTNRHFGRISEVWKHLVLAEVLAAEQPRVVLDSHAGDALYEVVDDPERRFGVLGFAGIVDQEPVLKNSAYAGVLSSLRTGPTLQGIPGGPLVAMTVLGDTAEYLFCDLDDNSARSVRELATQRGVHSARVLITDGLEAVRDELGRHDPATVVVFIDPFDHHAVGPTGLSALDLAVEAAQSRAALVYWYGYDSVEERTWISTTSSSETLRSSCGAAM